MVTFNTGGSSESVNEKTGKVVNKGDFEALCIAISTVVNCGKKMYSNSCREYAEKNFSKEKYVQQYINLYKQCKDTLNEQGEI